jgi:hypothetical protein
MRGVKDDGLTPSVSEGTAVVTNRYRTDKTAVPHHGASSYTLLHNKLTLQGGHKQMTMIDLTAADFNDARNYAIDVKQNRLKKTKFALPEAVSLLKGLDIVLRE